MKTLSVRDIKNLIQAVASHNIDYAMADIVDHFSISEVYSSIMNRLYDRSEIEAALDEAINSELNREYP